MDQIIAVFTFLWSIIETLWFGLTTMLTGLISIVNEIFSSGLF